MKATLTDGDQKYLEGLRDGIRLASTHLKEKAVKLFREGHDFDAADMRRLGEELILEYSNKIRG